MEKCVCCVDSFSQKCINQLQFRKFHFKICLDCIIKTQKALSTTESRSFWIVLNVIVCNHPYNIITNILLICNKDVCADRFAFKPNLFLLHIKDRKWRPITSISMTMSKRWVTKQGLCAEYLFISTNTSSKVPQWLTVYLKYRKRWDIIYALYWLVVGVSKLKICQAIKQQQAYCRFSCGYQNYHYYSSVPANLQVHWH